MRQKIIWEIESIERDKKREIRMLNTDLERDKLECILFVQQRAGQIQETQNIDTTSFPQTTVPLLTLSPLHRQMEKMMQNQNNRNN